jgi:DNA gyrase subunit A
MEDLIPEEDVVVTITRGGYAKRTKVNEYRSQRRGGKGVRGRAVARRGCGVALLHHDQPSLAALLHQPRPGLSGKAYDLPDAGRDAKGQHVANLLAFQPGEAIAAVLAIQ